MIFDAPAKTITIRFERDGEGVFSGYYTFSDEFKQWTKDCGIDAEISVSRSYATADGRLELVVPCQIIVKDEAAHFMILAAWA